MAKYVQGEPPARGAGRLEGLNWSWRGLVAGAVLAIALWGVDTWRVLLVWAAVFLLREVWRDG